MAVDADGEDWLYHLPAFLNRLREVEAQSVIDSFDARLGGVLYHHRGIRVPGYDATFVLGEGTFELEVDAVGDRAAWAVFDAAHDWDFFLSKAPGDAAVLAWMSDAEYSAEEAETFETKTEAVGLGRFSFGLYLQPPADWDDLEERMLSTDGPCLIHRPSGRMLVPEGPLGEYDEVVPVELLDRAGAPPEHLGLVEAHISGGGRD